MNDVKLLIFINISWLISLSTPSSIEEDPEVSGHFFDSDEDIHNQLNFLRDAEDLDVSFMLFTRAHPGNFYMLHPGNKESVSSSDFDPSKDTKIIIHGWRNGFSSNFSVHVREAYLDRYDANVINVDWSTQSYKNYVSSRLDVSKVAKVVAQMIDYLVTEFGMKSSKVHIIGHSLGAHIAGIAGKSLSTGKIARITGLDPALPMFTVYQDGRLKDDSAVFVDVIHSCGNLLGFKSALGQVDFYPNGGTFVQPGCGFDYKGKCSHSRAYNYFVESIKSNNFTAVKCTDWESFTKSKCSSETVLMGEYVPTSTRGKFYLTTNTKAPYSRGSVVFPPEIPTEDLDVPTYFD